MNMLLQKLINKRIESYQSELIEKYCAEVESMYTKMRGWRHDYHNHIQVMQASMALGRYEEVKEYLHQLNDDLTNVDTTIKTGQVMVDAILNGKLALAAKNNIPVNVKARLPEKLSIRTIDLCVIIGNLLDNAIEENINLPEEDRFLRIYIGVKNTQLYLCFTNAAGKRKVKYAKTFLSTKGTSHGFGVSRVESIVKKYEGFFSADSEDGGFTAEILLPLE